MIQKLRRKFVLIVMAVVSLILLAIFFTMLLTTQKNNERMSVGLLRQALNAGSFPDGGQPFGGGKPDRAEGLTPRTRLPVLVVEIDREGKVTALLNQLHFVEEDEIAPISALALDRAESVGTLRSYGLRYLREATETGVRIAFADISVEREMLQTQIANSLLIGGSAMLAFFLLSLLLARWAVGPVEAAWEGQRQFIANASHELKTPLTVILSNADMLRTEEAAGDKNARRVEHIHAEAVRMRRLVEDMLMLAQADSKEKTEIHEIVDFSYLTKSAVLMYEPMIYDEGKRLTYEIEDGLSVRGDPAQLQQVLHILLDNARKYSPPGLPIRLRLSRAEHKSLLLAVSNAGDPIPKEERERIFLRFYRRDEARSEHGSFGLGLSIARSIVDAHHGRIWADSDEESGNRFSVSLPLA